MMQDRISEKKPAVPIHKLFPETTKDYVVIDEKRVHPGQLHAAASSGGSTISFPHGKGLRFVKSEPTPEYPQGTVLIQIVDAGCGKRVASQSWQKSKVVVKKQDKNVKVEKSNKEVTL